MLIERDGKHGAHSIYECDRCKVRLPRTKIWQIKAGLDGKDYKLLCHLCNRCYSALERGINKRDCTHD